MGLLDNYKKSQVVMKREVYKSNFDYSEFNEIDKENLLELEKRAIHTGKILKENLLELGEVFLEAQEIFANNKNGQFALWYEGLGYKKDFVYLCLERKRLAMNYGSSKIYELPDRAIKDIKKIRQKDETQVDEILEAENPREKLEEIKKILFPKVIIEVDDDLSEDRDFIKRKISSLLPKLKNNNLDEAKLKNIKELLLMIEKEFE